MQTRIACLCFLILICLSGWSWAVPPNTLIFNGRLVTSDATAFIGYQEFPGTIRIGTFEGTTFRLFKEYSRIFKLQDGAFEVAISDSDLKNLNYLNNDYYVITKINATLSPTPEFTSGPLGSSPYAFMAYNQKGGTIYAVGTPPLTAGNERIKGEMLGTNFGIKGRGYFESSGPRPDSSGAIVGRIGAMEVYGLLSYDDGAKKYGLYASTGTYDPLYAYSTYTLDWYPIEYGYAVHTTGWGGGLRKGIGLYGKSNNSSSAAVYCENRYTGTGGKGSAVSIGGEIQFKSGTNTPAGTVTFRGGSTPPMAVVLSNTLIKTGSIILLTVQNGYKERVFVHNLTDGQCWILRDFSSGVSPHPDLEIAYLIIN